METFVRILLVFEGKEQILKYYNIRHIDMDIFMSMHDMQPKRTKLTDQACPKSGRVPYRFGERAVDVSLAWRCKHIP